MTQTIKSLWFKDKIKRKKKNQTNYWREIEEMLQAIMPGEDGKGFIWIITNHIKIGHCLNGIFKLRRHSLRMEPNRIKVTPLNVLETTSGKNKTKGAFVALFLTNCWKEFKNMKLERNKCLWNGETQQQWGKTNNRRLNTMVSRKADFNIFSVYSQV